VPWKQEDKNPHSLNNIVDLCLLAQTETDIHTRIFRLEWIFINYFQVPHCAVLLAMDTRLNMHISFITIHERITEFKFHCFKTHSFNVNSIWPHYHCKWNSLYSKVPVIWHAWRMGCTGYMYLSVAWERLLQKSNTKSKQHIFTLVFAWASS
jgi:hypothetical protein